MTIITTLRRARDGRRFDRIHRQGRALAMATPCPIHGDHNLMSCAACGTLRYVLRQGKFDYFHRLLEEFTYPELECSCDMRCDWDFAGHGDPADLGCGWECGCPQHAPADPEPF